MLVLCVWGLDTWTMSVCGVVCSQERRIVKYKYRCGEYPSTGDFYLLMYNDRYMASLMEVWRVVVHTALRYL